MVGPLVSTHDAAVELLASLTDVPHADRPKAAAVSTAGTSSAARRRPDLPDDGTPSRHVLRMSFFMNGHFLRSGWRTSDSVQIQTGAPRTRRVRSRTRKGSYPGDVSAQSPNVNVV